MGLSFTWVRLLGAGALTLFTIAVLWSAADRWRVSAQLSDLRDDVAGCAEAARDINGNSVDRCPTDVGAAILAAHKSASCDAALTLSADEGRYSVRSACSSAVLRLHADRDAVGAEAASLRGVVHNLETQQTAAVQRAEARGAAAATQKERANAAILSAPGSPDQRSCDAECLRALGG